MMKTKNDPLIRDGKKLPLDINKASLLFKFVVSSVLVLPVTLTGLVFVAAEFLFLKKKKQSLPSPESSGLDNILSVLKKPDPEKFDLVLFGATGFTGKLAAHYIAKTYGSSFKWAIAGRRQEALQEIKEELMKEFSMLTELGIVVADSVEPESIERMVISTKVIITTAGPFDKYGESVVKFCASMNLSHSRMFSINQSINLLIYQIFYCDCYSVWDSLL